MTRDEIRVGDRITFKALCRWPTRTVNRTVNGHYLGSPTVRFAGCHHFVVRPCEVTKVYGPRWGQA